MKYALDHNNNQEKYGENFYHRNCSVTSRECPLKWSILSKMIFAWFQTMVYEESMCILARSSALEALSCQTFSGLSVCSTVSRRFCETLLTGILCLTICLMAAADFPCRFNIVYCFEKTLVLYLNLWRSKFYSSRNISQEWRLRDFFARVRFVSNITCQGG